LYVELEASCFLSAEHGMVPASYALESLISDPLHGYITFTAARGAGEIAEQTLIDHPWVQRLRQIHQLQSAWWVYPSAEHSRFQHVLGSMHLASRAVAHLYDSLQSACGTDQVPSRAYVESLMRVAALLHDVGHGPYGHFFDDQFLGRFGLTHEDLGQHIILSELAAIIRGIRANPHGLLGTDETLQPEHVAYLIKRPADGAEASAWLRLLRSLFSGVYTVDNMDFVLRDSYMSGHSPRAFDLERLLHYSFFTPGGLTLHARGLDTLVHFVEARSELFRTLYFHRTVRAIDLMMSEIFGPTMELLFPGNPLEDLDRYRRLTEWSLLVDVERLADDADSQRRRLGQAWQAILQRRVHWKTACEHLIRFDPGEPEMASIFTDAALVESRVRSQLPGALRDLPFHADIARHSHRPIGSEAARQNFIFEPATSKVRPLNEHERFSRLPVTFVVCRLYALDHGHDAELAMALNQLLQQSGDDKTNM
jgi:HD superfamily phosphohydrolase